MPVDIRPTISAPDDDPYLWLEEIEGPRALEFVERQSRLTLEQFGGAPFADDRDALAAIYDRPDNIPYVTRRGGLLYNLWKDAKTRAASGAEPRLRNFASRSRHGKPCSTSTSLPPRKIKTGCWVGRMRLPKQAHARS